MQLRSATRRKEFEELKNVLLGMELFEEDMNLEEMRALVSTLNRSASMNSTALLQDSELDYLDPLQPNEDGVLSSTVLDVPVVQQALPARENPVMSVAAAMTPFSSPEVEKPAELVTIEAEVHRELDWSPTASTESGVQNEESTPEYESDESQEGNETPPDEATSDPVLRTFAPADSGCGLVELTFSSSSSNSGSPPLDANEFDDEQETGPSTPPYTYPHDCNACMDYIVNKENIACYNEGSSSDNIDYDRDHMSEFSN